MPPNPLSQPPYAWLDASLGYSNTDPTFWWNNPESKLLWRRAVDKMSRVMSAVIEDVLRSEAQPNTPIHLPTRPIAASLGLAMPSASWAIYGGATRPSLRQRATVQVEEILWYAVPSDERGEI